MTPEVQFIAITQADGSLAVMQFVTKGLLDQTTVFEREATDEAIEAEIAKSQIEASSWRRIEPSDVPKDRTFREAWRDTGKIEIDMPSARNIHRERLRALRAPKLAALDVEYQRADEAGNAANKKAIAARKQALRDVTKDPAIDAAATPEELAAIIPAALK